MDPSCRFVVVCDLGLAVARSSWAPARSTRTSKLRHGFCTIPMDAFMTTWAPYQQGRTAKEIKNKGMIQCWTLEMMHGMVTGGPMVTQSTERGLTHCDSVRNDVYGFFLSIDLGTPRSTFGNTMSIGSVQRLCMSGECQSEPLSTPSTRCARTLQTRDGKRSGPGEREGIECLACRRGTLTVTSATLPGRGAVAIRRERFRVCICEAVLVFHDSMGPSLPQSCCNARWCRLIFL